MRPLEPRGRSVAAARACWRTVTWVSLATVFVSQACQKSGPLPGSGGGDAAVGATDGGGSSGNDGGSGGGDGGPGGGDGGVTSVPPREVPPANLGPDGIIVEQPHAGDPCTGQWLSVTGWIDPSRWATVLILGAPVPDFYAAPGGHMPVPTVPVISRADGRFVAPRVPLTDGTTTVYVAPLPRGGGRPTPDSVTSIALECSGTTPVPATITASPAFGPPPLTVTFTASGFGPGTVQWDFDGDGVMDLQEDASAAATYTYKVPGRYRVFARQQNAGMWIYGAAVVSVSPSTTVLADAVVTSPAALSVVLDEDGWNAAQIADQIDQSAPEPLDDDVRFVRYVLATDGDQVKVFDGNLSPLQTLTGFSGPKGVAGDWLGRIYVADTGNNIVKRFLADGTVDVTFGNGGSIGGPAGSPFSRPTALATHKGLVQSSSAGDDFDVILLVLDQGNDRLVVCARDSDTAWGCQPFTSLSCRGCTDTDTFVGLSTLAPEWNHESADESGTGTLLGMVAATPAAVYRRSLVGGISGELDLVARPRQPLSSICALGELPPEGAAYLIGADASGTLHEWVAGASPGPELRQLSLEFPVSAVACDPYGTSVQRRVVEAAAAADGGSPLGFSPMQTGPLVVYVAGAGHLQRRAVPSLSWRSP